MRNVCPIEGARRSSAKTRQREYDDDLEGRGAANVSGIARVKNVGSQSLTGTFTFTFFQSGTIVGTAQGSAQEVSPGQTVTVQLVSQDKMFAGRFRYQFQVDIEF